MKPTLLIFDKENPNNDPVDFFTQMKPRTKFEDLSQKEIDFFLKKRPEILQKIEALIHTDYLDETTATLSFDDEDEFPCRKVMTGNYYIESESYSVSFWGKNGHPYDIKNGQYRDLWARDENGYYTNYLPLHSEEVIKGFQIIFTVHFTYNDDGEERDYMSLDFSADLHSLEDEIEFEILGMEGLG